MGKLITIQLTLAILTISVQRIASIQWDELEESDISLSDIEPETSFEKTIKQRDISEPLLYNSNTQNDDGCGGWEMVSPQQDAPLVRKKRSLLKKLCKKKFKKWLKKDKDDDDYGDDYKGKECCCNKGGYEEKKDYGKCECKCSEAKPAYPEKQITVKPIIHLVPIQSYGGCGKPKCHKPKYVPEPKKTAQVTKVDVTTYQAPVKGVEGGYGKDSGYGGGKGGGYGGGKMEYTTDYGCDDGGYSGVSHGYEVSSYGGGDKGHGGYGGGGDKGYGGGHGGYGGGHGGYGGGHGGHGGSHGGGYDHGYSGSKLTALIQPMNKNPIKVYRSKIKEPEPIEDEFTFI